VGQRANFEENYTGNIPRKLYCRNLLSRQDKSRLVENGYPEYFAKVLNAPNWI
jgi:maltose phosphorylase